MINLPNNIQIRIFQVSSQFYPIPIPSPPNENRSQAAKLFENFAHWDPATLLDDVQQKVLPLSGEGTWCLGPGTEVPPRLMRVVRSTQQIQGPMGWDDGPRSTRSLGIPKDDLNKSTNI